MGATDVTETLDVALAITGVDQIQIKHRPHLLSDNGSAYVSGELRDYLDEWKMTHTRGAPYHSQTQGKIERYHRTMKNVVKLEHNYHPWEFEAALRDFVAYYNNERYHDDGSEVQFSPSVKVRTPQGLRESRGGSAGIVEQRAHPLRRSVPGTCGGLGGARLSGRVSPSASRPPRLKSGPVEGTSGRGVPQTVPHACPLDVPGSWLIQSPPDGVTLRT
jgi:hypothetical protein